MRVYMCIWCDVIWYIMCVWYSVICNVYNYIYVVNNIIICHVDFWFIYIGQSGTNIFHSCKSL